MKCDGLWDICVAFLVGGIYVLSANTIYMYTRGFRCVACWRHKCFMGELMYRWNADFEVNSG